MNNKNININEICEQISTKIPESTCGIILNNQYKDKYPENIRDLIFEHIREEQACFKIVFQNVEIDPKVVNNIVSKGEEKKETEVEAMDIENIKTEVDIWDMSVLLDKYAKEINKSGELKEILRRFEDGKVYTYDNVNLLFIILLLDNNQK